MLRREVMSSQVVKIVTAVQAEVKPSSQGLSLRRVLLQVEVDHPSPFPVRIRTLTIAPPDKLILNFILKFHPKLNFVLIKLSNGHFNPQTSPSS